MKLKEYLKNPMEMDIIGITDLSLISMNIKRFTWKYELNQPWWKVIFRQDLSSHIAVVVRGLDGQWMLAEMQKTTPVVRYLHRVDMEIITPEEYAALHPAKWPNYKEVKIRSGLKLAPFKKYMNKTPKQHIVFIGRHSAFANAQRREAANEYLFAAHRAGKSYDNRALLEFPGFLKWANVEDCPDRWICSEMPRDAFNYCDIDYPVEWNEKCSPMDWQLWSELRKISIE